MDNPEKLTTQGTQDEDKQKENTTQYVLDTTIISFSSDTGCLSKLVFIYFQLERTFPVEQALDIRDLASTTRFEGAMKHL